LVNLACASWAGLDDRDRRTRVSPAEFGPKALAPLILFPQAGTTAGELAQRVRQERAVGKIATTATTVALERDSLTSRELRQWLEQLPIEYAEPDCDGPNFATTSAELPRASTGDASRCWMDAARSNFPNDPCINDLWGHQAIGWTADIASRSKPRLVAVIDSGVDAAHEDLAGAIRSSRRLRRFADHVSEVTDASCRGAGGCYPHGTQMAGTIAGRMNNGVGLAGVAPNSQLIPIRIARVDHGNLMRLSSIAAAIEVAADSGADVINVSAKWPVDSRAVREAIIHATGGASDKPKRLLVTGYTVSFGSGDELVEGYPSKYRYLPGVIAAAPGVRFSARDVVTRARDSDPSDGPIMAPGVDIVVTTTQNASGAYAVSQAAGASSAAAYTSGAIALVWGTAPLNKCNALEIKRLLFCRSRATNQTKYPWINVEFLQEMARLPASTSCAAALAAAGCAN
jgi:hypothetical protein